MTRRWAVWGLAGLLGLGAAARGSANEHERYEHHQRMSEPHSGPNEHFESHEREHPSRPRPDYEPLRRFDDANERQRVRRFEESQHVAPLDEGARFREGRSATARDFEERHFARPHVDVDGLQRRYTTLPEFRRLGTWGLAAPLKSNPGVAFLSDGLLVGSYLDAGRTVFVYVIDEDGTQKEFRVDESGRLLAERVLP